MITLPNCINNNVQFILLNLLYLLSLPFFLNSVTSLNSSYFNSFLSQNFLIYIMQIKIFYMTYVLFCVLCQKQLIKFDKSFSLLLFFFILIQHWKFPFINHLITQNSTTFLFGIKLLKENTQTFFPKK